MKQRAANNPYNIRFTQSQFGPDYLFTITGGDLVTGPHIGAVATAYWQDDELRVVCNELPTHREGDLARETALLAARKLGSTCTVVCGIHIDDATSEQIAEIVQYVRSGFNNLLEVKHA